MGDREAQIAERVAETQKPKRMGQVQAESRLSEAVPTVVKSGVRDETQHLYQEAMRIAKLVVQLKGLPPEIKGAAEEAVRGGIAAVKMSAETKAGGGRAGAEEVYSMEITLKGERRLLTVAISEKSLVVTLTNMKGDDIATYMQQGNKITVTQSAAER